MPAPNEPTPMTQFTDDRDSIMEELRKAGLLDFPELDDLRIKQEVGAGKMPKPKSGMAPMISSVPQADR